MVYPASPLAVPASLPLSHNNNIKLSTTSSDLSALHVQVEDLRAALATEQKAHRRAVQQYVDALDAKSDMQLQLEASQQTLAGLTAAHQALSEQHQQLQQHYGGLLGQCKTVRDICKHVDEALGLDPQLVQQVQQWQAANQQDPQQEGAAGASAQHIPQCEQEQEQEQAPAQLQQEQPGSADTSSSGGGTGSSAEPDGATDLQPLAERLEQQMQAMYASWRAASNARDVALTERFRMADQLRDAEEGAWHMQQQHKALQQTLQEAQQQLTTSQVRRLL
jgi:hypothetical protein